MILTRHTKAMNQETLK